MIVFKSVDNIVVEVGARGGAFIIFTGFVIIVGIVVVLVVLAGFVVVVTNVELLSLILKTEELVILFIIVVGWVVEVVEAPNPVILGVFALVEENVWKVFLLKDGNELAVKLGMLCLTVVKSSELLGRLEILFFIYGSLNDVFVDDIVAVAVIVDGINDDDFVDVDGKDGIAGV